MIGVMGVNHKTAPLSLREEIAKSICPKGPHILLSTCNRVEVYFYGEPPHDIPNPYAHFGRECFFHLARVTAGLDSAIILETEIQGQVKQAYEAARQNNLPSELHYLFQKSLKIGKEIRTSVQLCPHMADTESAILREARTIFPDQDPRILLVGASDINQKILEKFQRKNLDITLINRTPTISTVPVKPWEHLSEWHTYDIIIFATKCPDYLLTEAPELNTPKLIVDLSVPRNVDPALASHPQITLTNIEKIHSKIATQRHLNGELLHHLDSYIASKVDRLASKLSKHLDFIDPDLRTLGGL